MSRTTDHVIDLMNSNNTCSICGNLIEQKNIHEKSNFNNTYCSNPCYEYDKRTPKDGEPKT